MFQVVIIFLFFLRKGSSIKFLVQVLLIQYKTVSKQSWTGITSLPHIIRCGCHVVTKEMEARNMNIVFVAKLMYF